MQEYFYEMRVGTERLGTLSWQAHTEDDALIALKDLLKDKFDVVDLKRIKIEVVR